MQSSGGAFVEEQSRGRGGGGAAVSELLHQRQQAYCRGRPGPAFARLPPAAPFRSTAPTFSLASQTSRPRRPALCCRAGPAVKARAARPGRWASRGWLPAPAMHAPRCAMVSAYNNAN